MTTDPSAFTAFDPTGEEPATARGCVSWGEMAKAEPDLAASVLARFEASRHHVLATLRSDGAPRVSGTEVIIHDGILALGSMWLAMKARDLRRDGRFALHANPGDGSMEGGDAKVSGVAVELAGESAARIAASLPEMDEADPATESTPFHLFRLDLDQVVLSEVDHERNCMVIRSWWPDRGVVTVDR